MKNKLSILLLLIACSCNNSSKPPIAASSKIVLEIVLPPSAEENRVRIKYAPYDYAVIPRWEVSKPEIHGNIATWTLASDKPLLVDLTYFLGKGNMGHFYEPGDSIRITFNNKIPYYSGNNAAKFNMLQDVINREQTLKLPSNDDFSNVESLQDYQEWNNYLDTKLAIMDSAFTKHQHEISDFAFNHLKADAIVNIEYIRLMKFGALEAFMLYYGAPPKKLSAIFDTIAANPYGKWARDYDGNVGISYYYYDFVRRSIERRFDFNLENDTLKSTQRKILYADLAKQLYKGTTLQECLVYLITNQGLKEHTLKGFSPEIDTLLTAYYAMPGYPEYKEYVREYENRIRKQMLVAHGK